MAKKSNAKPVPSEFCRYCGCEQPVSYYQKDNYRLCFVCTVCGGRHERI